MAIFNSYVTSYQRVIIILFIMDLYGFMWIYVDLYIMIYIWLVVWTILKNMKVNGMGDIPYIYI